MEITAQQLFASLPELQALSIKDLKIKIAYDIKKKLKIIQNEIDIIKNLMKEKEEKIKAENFTKEVEEGKIKEEEETLLKTKINLDILPLKLEELGDIQIKPYALLILDYLIQE